MSFRILKIIEFLLKAKHNIIHLHSKRTSEIKEKDFDVPLVSKQFNKRRY